ncbi:MAG: hypothetical protein NTZ68_01210 [Candidatus Dependentiae bacterium]|nr:hypothetical protein [Candidatus Dependentiae bacterium]
MSNTKKLTLLLLAFANISFTSTYLERFNEYVDSFFNDNKLFNNFLNTPVNSDSESVRNALDYIATNNFTSLQDKHASVEYLLYPSPDASESYASNQFTPEEKERLLKLAKNYVTEKYHDFYHRLRLFGPPSNNP